MNEETSSQSNSGSALFAGKSNMVASLSWRADFAGPHLRAAARAACSAYDVEQTNSDITKNVYPWFDEIMMLVPASIVMLVLRLRPMQMNLFKTSLRDGRCR
jgi:hypothetical protein